MNLALSRNSACLARADVTPLADRVSTVAASLMQDHNIPGLVIGVVTRGGSVAFPFGVASKDTGQPVTKQTLFELGSVSKVYTATLAGLGLARGALAWSDPVSRHLPELNGTPISSLSLLHLGTYSAPGLPLQFPDDVTNLGSAIQYYRQWQPSGSPGSRRQYSNPSLGLFGHAIAAAMGADFDLLMNRELLSRLGLNETYTRVPAAVADHYAWGHDGDNRPVRVSPGVFDTEAYGIKASVSDMMRLIELNLDASALDAPFREAIAQTQKPRFRVGAMIQGLGWEQYPPPVSLAALLDGNSRAMIMESQAASTINPQMAQPGRLFNKTGSTGGFGAYVAFVPEAGVGVILLANRNYAIPARVEAAYRLLSEVADLKRS